MRGFVNLKHVLCEQTVRSMQKIMLCMFVAYEVALVTD